MASDRRGPAFTKRTALASLLLVSVMVAALVGWNMLSAPRLPAAPSRSSTPPLAAKDSFGVSLAAPTEGGVGAGAKVNSASKVLPTGGQGQLRAMAVTPHSGSSNTAMLTPFLSNTPHGVGLTVPEEQQVAPASNIAQYQDLLAGQHALAGPQAGLPNPGSKLAIGQSLTVAEAGPAVGRVGARGAELVDANGARFFVAGANYEGHTDRAWLLWENNKFDPNLIDANFALAQEGGYNSLRIFVQSQLRDDIRANNWSKFDKVVELAQKHGLRLLVTMGDYYEPDLNRLIEIDLSVSRHFAGSSVILGYDLRNEPQYGDLSSNIYPPGQEPPLQKEEIIRAYGERLNQAESDAWRNGAGRNSVPGHLNSRQAYVYANVLRYYAEFQSDMWAWVGQNGRATEMDYLNSPEAGKWKVFLDALDGTVQKYIELRQGALHQGDPGRLTTIGWNRPDLARMPANRSLGFVSFHRFPGDRAGGLAGTLAMLDHLKNFYSGKPVVLEEFGYSNSDGKNGIPLLRTASYETALWLFLYGRGYAGGYKWMLHNFPPGYNLYENNFGLTDDQTRPKPSYQAARAVLKMAAANRIPTGDFGRLETYDGLTITYTWGSSQAFFGNTKDFRDSRVQITQNDAAPWAVWWPTNGLGQVYLSLTGTGEVRLDLRAIFPGWKAGMRPTLSLENGASLNFQPQGDSAISFQAQPGTLYTVKIPVQPAAFNAASPLNVPNNIFFKETSHNLSNQFRRYWESRGGLALYGYPLSEEFQENGFQVQYFERARFEYHPENGGTANEVQLGLLGNLITSGRCEAGETPFQPVAPFNSTPTSRYYKETGHSLRGGFQAYWEANGSLAQFGYPLTEEFQELNPVDGKTYTVQYFERNRFEWHPENSGTTAEFQLGLLGLQVVKGRGWLV